MCQPCLNKMDKRKISQQCIRSEKEAAKRGQLKLLSSLVRKREGYLNAQRRLQLLRMDVRGWALMGNWSSVKQSNQEPGGWFRKQANYEAQDLVRVRRSGGRLSASRVTVNHCLQNLVLSHTIMTHTKKHQSVTQDKNKSQQQTLPLTGTQCQTYWKKNLRQLLYIFAKSEKEIQLKTLGEVHWP